VNPNFLLDALKNFLRRPQGKSRTRGPVGIATIIILIRVFRIVVESHEVRRPGLLTKSVYGFGFFLSLSKKHCRSRRLTDVNGRSEDAVNTYRYEATAAWSSIRSKTLFEFSPSPRDHDAVLYTYAGLPHQILGPYTKCFSGPFTKLPIIQFTINYKKKKKSRFVNILTVLMSFLIFIEILSKWKKKTSIH
jgi:hypothetical protein